MAGSQTWFQYKDDAGNVYSVVQDESNGIATVGGTRLAIARTAAHPAIPGRLRKRYLLAYLKSNPKVRRKFWVPNPLAIPQILASATMKAAVYASGADTVPVQEDWIISAYRGERGSVIPTVDATAGDTGLTDGSVGRDV
jgi:hypothetical protein